MWLSANLRLVPVESNSSPEKPAWLVWQFAGERSVWLHGGVPGLWARAGGAQMWLSHRARQRGQTREASPQARVQEVLPGLSRPELLQETLSLDATLNNLITAEYLSVIDSVQGSRKTTLDSTSFLFSSCLQSSGELVEKANL